MALFDVIPELSDGTVSIGRMTAEELPAAVRDREAGMKTRVIAGIYLADTLAGVAEMSLRGTGPDTVNIGCTVYERYRHRDIADRAVALMQRYLLLERGVSSLTALVMPEDEYFARALLRCGFVKQPERPGGDELNEIRVDVYTCDVGGAYGTVGCL